MWFHTSPAARRRWLISLLRPSRVVRMPKTAPRSVLIPRNWQSVKRKPRPLHGVRRSGNLQRHTKVQFLPWVGLSITQGMFPKTNRPNLLGIQSAVLSRSNMWPPSRRPLGVTRLLWIPPAQPRQAHRNRHHSQGQAPGMRGAASRFRPHRKTHQARHTQSVPLPKQPPPQQQGTCLAPLQIMLLSPARRQCLQLVTCDPPPAPPWLHLTPGVCRREAPMVSLWHRPLLQPMLRAA